MYTSCQYINIIKINQKLIYTILFHSIQVYLNLPNGVLHYKAKLKSTGDKASPGFKTFLIGNVSDKYLPIQSLLYISVRQNVY
jgi:hypothetical protein